MRLQIGGYERYYAHARVRKFQFEGVCRSEACVLGNCLHSTTRLTIPVNTPVLWEHQKWLEDDRPYELIKLGTARIVRTLQGCWEATGTIELDERDRFDADVLHFIERGMVRGLSLGLLPGENEAPPPRILREAEILEVSLCRHAADPLSNNLRIREVIA